ncbi:MAG: amidohydrolase family protein [Candidatus Latescibacteria bacterium]|jgi:L-fuconolactonase|nr:amidohydrolase family protein [Candidatus Latescibacterota bacterium]MBT4137424.1 amidohydrolase family protein [Candidatus Latescibacterota bacterium]MBT5831500.1 amidohydrolase family protein [Candidatus Latescibacterota bacterium]
MIVDTHIHIYDPTRPQGVPFPEPDDEVLYRRVLPDDYKALAVPLGVTGTIIVEASVWAEDNQWVLDVIADDPFVLGLVGNLDPRADDFGDLLDRFAPSPLFLGIRPRTYPWERENLDEMTKAYEKLVAYDLELDSGANESTIELAKRLPELRIVINHCGNIPADGNSIDPEKLTLMQRAAECPNIFCKVSGLMDLRCKVRPAPTDLVFYTPLLDALWDMFGEDRVIYGSDWPVLDYSERTVADAQNLVHAYFSEKGDDVLEKYFWKNAKKAYKWIDRG